MAARGLFVNFSQPTVEDILEKAQTLLLDGKTIMSYGDQGTNVTKQFTMPIDEVLEECNHALRVLDPEQYGRIKDTRRTHSNFGARCMEL